MSYKVYASEAYVNEKEAKLNEEIGKRPIAYDPIIKDGVTIDPGKKITADLIDAEWMATSSTQDLNIVITPETAGSFEVIDDGNGGSATKLSDIAPTLEQLKSGAFTIGTETISFADATITQEEGLDGYAVNGMLMVVNNDMHLGGITLEKGMYVLGEINDDFFAYLDANYANIYIPNIAPGVNLLPEKFIPDTIARTEELEKRPIAYEGYKKEPLTIEYDGVVGDKYQCRLSDAAGYVSYVKVSDMILDLEDLYSRELSFSDSYFFDDMKVTSISDLNSSLGISGIGIFGGNVGFPIVMAVKEPSNNGEYGNVQQSGIYFMHVQHPDEGDIYVTKLHLPSHTTKEIVKMSPDLIDAAWMAKSGSLEVEVNSENISNYLTDEISDLGAMFGFDVVLKLSDYFVSQDEFINGKCITEFGEVAGTEIPLIMWPGTADMGYTVTITNLWAYQLSDYCLLVADEGASVYVQDMNATFSVPKGIYLGADSEEELHALGTLKFYCPEVADVIVPLPEKFLSDMVVQAGTKTGYFPLDIEWDGEIGDRETNTSSNETGAFVKVSDLCDLTKEQLLTSAITLKSDTASVTFSDLTIKEEAYGYALCVPGQVEGNATSVTFVHVVHTPNDEFKSAGIYFVKTDLLNIGYVSNLRIQSYYQTITKKIDPELVDMEWYAGKRSKELNLTVPSDITGYETAILQDNDLAGNPTSYTFVKLSSLAPTFEELKCGYISAGDSAPTLLADALTDDTEYTVLRQETIEGVNVIVFGVIVPIIIVVSSDVTWEGTLFTKGAYILTGTEKPYHLYIPYVEEASGEIIKLPEKYLPQETTNLNNLENGDTLVETIFNLFASGGGVTDMGMEYVNRIIGAFENKTFVEFTVSAVGYKIKCPLTCISDTDDGLLRQVSFTFLMDYSGVSRVTVFLLANKSSENLRVLVETFQ